MDTSYPEEDEAIEMAIREAETMYLTNASSVSTKTNANKGSETQDQQQQLRCSYCGTLSTDERLLRDFGLAVCFPCKMARKDEFKCMSKSKAMKEYLLNDEQIGKLKSATVINPNKIGWHDMKLYLVSQVKKEAMRVWGSLEELEEEKKRRAEARLIRGSKKKLQQKKSLVAPLQTNSGSSLIEKEVKRQRNAAALGANEDETGDKSKKHQTPLPDVFSKGHVHKFGSEKPTGRPDEFVKKCHDCGLEVTFEMF